MVNLKRRTFLATLAAVISTPAIASIIPKNVSLARGVTMTGDWIVIEHEEFRKGIIPTTNGYFYSEVVNIYQHEIHKIRMKYPDNKIRLNFISQVPFMTNGQSFGVSLAGLYISDMVVAYHPNTGQQKIVKDRFGIANGMHI